MRNKTPAGTRAPFASLGWKGSDAYEDGSAYHTRIVQFLDKINWNELKILASELHNHVGCSFSEKFSVGQTNLVRQIIFDDGTTWVARIRMPSLDDDTRSSDLVTADIERELEGEIAALNFLKLKTSIPVPTPHSFSPINDRIGAPYLLMDYIDGVVAHELSQTLKCDPGTFGTPDQDRVFRQTLANYQVELSNIKFDKIGSLYQSKNDLQSFYIGPLMLPGNHRGPWSTAEDYYEHLSENLMRDYNEGVEEQHDHSFFLPLVCKDILKRSHKTQPHQFSLANTDFGAHNILVDSQFRVMGVIDFDGLMTAPIEVAAQLPRLIDVQIEPPGFVPTAPASLERVQRQIPLIAKYESMIRAAELTLGGGKTITSVMWSNRFFAYSALQDYKMHNRSKNVRWMDAMLKIYSAVLEQK